jgi:hypothetical protein
MKSKERRIGTQKELVFPVPMKTSPADESENPRQSADQCRVQQLAEELTEKYSQKLGLSRREFLSTSCGMAVVFMARTPYSAGFTVDTAEAADLAVAQERTQALAGQFIFDVQTHCVSPTYTDKWILELRKRAKKWNPELRGEKATLDKLKFDNFYREIYDLSDTKIAMLSSAPSDDPNMVHPQRR